jgi:hypothetical protein
MNIMSDRRIAQERRRLFYVHVLLLEWRVQQDFFHDKQQRAFDLLYTLNWSLDLTKSAGGGWYGVRGIKTQPTSSEKHSKFVFSLLSLSISPNNIKSFIP